MFYRYFLILYGAKETKKGFHPIMEILHSARKKHEIRSTIILDKKPAWVSYVKWNFRPSSFQLMQKPKVFRIKSCGGLII